ncbi:Hypp2893 [Branchiostoma lanceolatum]|uniref:Hypp2893 protein n=1 Tax=Branchiostoma lanceolatum TaxID=7740 RepID=A0A8J9ZUZ6_BRALA|nr:Hypp2893 [Branchiostoma lanceolatum]
MQRLLERTKANKTATRAKPCEKIPYKAGNAYATMSNTTPQYFLEFTFTASAQNPLNELVTGTVNAVAQATKRVKNGRVLFLFKVLAEAKLIAGLTQEELFKIWKEEAIAGLAVMEQGGAKLWKVVSERKIQVLLKMPTPDLVDNTFTVGLPLFKQHGNQVHTTCKAVVPYM